jgi:hypothetical protein
VEALGKATKKYDLPVNSQVRGPASAYRSTNDCKILHHPDDVFLLGKCVFLRFQELVFMGERCLDHKALSDYGINRDFIMQVGKGTQTQSHTFT